MKTVAIALSSLLLVSASAFAAGAATGTSVGDHVPAFTAKTVDLSAAEAKSADFDSQKTGRPTVFVFAGTQCPTTQSYIDRLRALEQTYRPRDVDFVYVYPNRTDTPDAKVTFHKEKKLTGVLIDDQNATIAKALGAQKTAEALVVSKDGEILYRGAIDDGGREPEKVTQRYVATALDEYLASKPVTTKSAPVSA